MNLCINWRLYWCWCWCRRGFLLLLDFDFLFWFSNCLSILLGLLLRAHDNLKLNISFLLSTDSVSKQPLGNENCRVYRSKCLNHIKSATNVGVKEK